MARILKSLAPVVLALLAGCETMPEGPTVTALPGETKSADQFRNNDRECRQYANARANGLASASPDAVADGHDTIGSVIDGIDSAQYVGYGLQQRYNRAYVRCMYIKGNSVPLLAREQWPSPRSPWPPDPEAYYFPLQR
jgi:hypothetical protein